MVKFSCFLSPIHHSRSKKIVHQTSRPMKPDTRESTQNLAMKASCVPDNDHSVASVDQLTSPSSPEGCWKSDDHNGNSCSDENKEFLQKVQLKKSQSLGNMIDKRREYGDDDITEENETDHDFSFGYSHEKDMNRKCGDLLSNTGSAGVQDHRTEEDMHSKDQDNNIAGPFESDPDRGHHKSIFSIGVMKPFDGDEQHDYTDEHSSGHAPDSIHPSSNTLPTFEKSHSVTDLRLDTANSVEGAATHELVPSRSKSFGDLSSLKGRRSEFLNDEDTHQSEETKQKHITATYSHHKPEASDTDGKCLPGCAYSEEECLFSNMSGECNEVAEHDSYGRYSSEKFKSDNQSFDGYEPHNYDGLRNEWREAERNVPEMNEDHQQDSLIQNWDDLTPEEFTTRRIEQWISQIDSYAGCSEQEVGESSHHATKKDHHVSKKDPHVVAVAKQDGGNLGMEVAYNYITSLNAASSSAQMSNLGLVAVPFLGAFTSLRVLNLSGNAIVRITSGALPRGLHVLNLSKNSISTIEGLRDLTRLRVLDLSFNRILRIGHGLAFCSSLKELYLASNKISEVEGLHRLLKLNVLDLRFNKISTAKALGQLAANYGSLQAIYLEGNPAQRNVGDEQLKKYLLSVLPHLVYYNKQTIRSSSSKDVADRSQRSLTSHQFDRGTRAEQSHSRRSSAHGSALHGRTSPAMSSRVKQSKNKHARLPPAGSKGIHHQQPNGGTVQLPLILGNPIRRTRSENML